MIMIDQSKRLSEPLRWGRRERTVVAALLVCVALAVAGLGGYALTSGARARVDCINVTFASTLGGAREHACGSQARRVCASGSFHAIEQELRAACRRAGFPFSSS
jgi:predicted secreted protein